MFFHPNSYIARWFILAGLLKKQKNIALALKRLSQTHSSIPELPDQTFRNSVASKSRRLAFLSYIKLFDRRIFRLSNSKTFGRVVLRAFILRHGWLGLHFDLSDSFSSSSFIVFISARLIHSVLFFYLYSPSRPILSQIFEPLNPSIDSFLLVLKVYTNILRL